MNKKTTFKEGYSPAKKGYQPTTRPTGGDSSGAGAGHKPNTNQGQGGAGSPPKKP